MCCAHVSRPLFPLYSVQNVSVIVDDFDSRCYILPMIPSKDSNSIRVPEKATDLLKLILQVSCTWIILVIMPMKSFFSCLFSQSFAHLYPFVSIFHIATNVWQPHLLWKCQIPATPAWLSLMICCTICACNWGLCSLTTNFFKIRQLLTQTFNRMCMHLHPYSYVCVYIHM